MTDKESMKLALEALEAHADIGIKSDKAITALKEQLAQPHETTLKEFNQLIHDDPKYYIWAKEKALQTLHDENKRLGLYRDAYAEQEPVAHQKWCASLTQLLMSMPPQPASCNCRPPQRTEQEPVELPCCGYTDADAVKWNPFNGVVQCHNCGQCYTAPPQENT